MMVEITLPIVFGGIGACSALCAGAFALGNLQWYRRSEGTELAGAVKALADALKGLTDLRAEVRDGFTRVHQRIDENSKEIAHLSGACAQVNKGC
jgi:hypothetical protein